MEKYFFFLFLFHHPFFRGAGSLVYPVCEDTSLKKYDLGSDFADIGIGLEYHSGERVYEGDSRRNYGVCQNGWSGGF